MYNSEPNGNTYENCGEFLVDTLDDGWNDYDCTQPLPFICEKKGDNYVPPPGIFWIWYTIHICHIHKVIKL